MIRRHWPILMLIAAPIGLLAPIALMGRVLYWGVPLLQFYPWQHLAVELWQSGQLPLWNSLAGSGAPLAANLQTGAFYPLNFLHLVLPTEYAQSYTALLHVILAGLFMYAYLRALKLQPFAAAIGAVAFQLCGFLIARLAFFSVTATFPWLAAWLWRSEKLVAGGGQLAAGKRRAAFGNMLWLAVAIGLGVLAGHAQTAVYGLVFAGAYFLWRIITLSRGRRVFRSQGRQIVAFSAAVALGLGLAAIQLLPAAELTRESQRAGGLDYVKVMTHSYWPPRLLTLLSPDFFGSPAQNNFWGYDNYWENASYIGVLPLLLALWAVAASIRKRPANKAASHTSALTPFFAIVVIVSLVLAFGWFTPLYPFLYRTIPGFGLFQGPARWLVVTVPALCVLAAIGAQQWVQLGVSRRAAMRWVMLGVATTLAGLVAMLVLTDRISTFGPATLRLGVVLIVVGWLLRSGLRNGRSEVIVVTVVALDLITAHFALNPTLEPAIYHAQDPTAVAIAADGRAGRTFYFDADEEAVKFGVFLAHAEKFDGYGPAGLDFWLSARAALLPNAGMIDELPSANNFDSLIVGRYQNLLDQINQLPFEQALALLGRMDVAYIVSPRALDLPILARTRDVTIYRNPQVQPRAWIAPQEADRSRLSTVVNGSAIVSLTDSTNAVTIRAASPSPGWLVLADTWYPGWLATLDGTAVPIEVANGAFRAVRFPAGTHEVEFRYEPQSVVVGSWITLVSGLVMLIGLVVSTDRLRIHEAANG
jgi:hypothetical protein